MELESPLLNPLDQLLRRTPLKGGLDPVTLSRGEKNKNKNETEPSPPMPLSRGYSFQVAKRGFVSGKENQNADGLDPCPPFKGGENQNEDGGLCIYSLLQTVTAEIIAWAKPGMRVSDLDKKAREMLGTYEPYFTHSL